MRRYFNFFYLCAIVTLSIVPGIIEVRGNNGVLKSWKETAFKKTEEGLKGVISHRSGRVRMKCDTPNGTPGCCIGIKRCPALLKQIEDTHAWEFLRASRCGRARKVSKNPKVCCEIGNFNNITNDNVLPKSCGHQKLFLGNRIFGGREASPYEYPWMALLLHRNFYDIVTLGCAGFLIHTNYVMTAAHCTHPDTIRQKGPIVSVLLGKHNIQTSTNCLSYGFGCGKNTQIHEIAKVFTHPQYDPDDKGHYNDIAIIRLKQDARLTDYVQPICLAKDDSPSPTTYYVSGWGKTESGTKSKVKMQVEIRPFDKKTCSKLYFLADIILRDTQLCAGGEELSDTCSGDSGGPLMMSTDGIWYASGIVSFGLGCGVKDWPGVYTNTVKFLPWIKSVMVQKQR